MYKQMFGGEDLEIKRKPLKIKIGNSVEIPLTTPTITSETPQIQVLRDSSPLQIVVSGENGALSAKSGSSLMYLSGGAGTVEEPNLMLSNDGDEPPASRGKVSIKINETGYLEDTFEAPHENNMTRTLSPQT